MDEIPKEDLEFISKHNDRIKSLIEPIDTYVLDLNELSALNFIAEGTSEPWLVAIYKNKTRKKIKGYDKIEKFIKSLKK